jgi:hypothetical protein
MSARRLSMLTSTTFHGAEGTSALVVAASGATIAEDAADGEAEGEAPTGGAGVLFEQAATAMLSAMTDARGMTRP